MLLAEQVLEGMVLAGEMMGGGGSFWGDIPVDQVIFLDQGLEGCGGEEGGGIPG